MQINPGPCSITLASGVLRYASRVGVATFLGFGRPVLFCRDRMISGSRDGCICTRWIYTEYFANPNLSGCCEMLDFRVCGLRQNFNEFSLYRNPNLDNRIFYCLVISMAAVHKVWGCACFFPVCGWFEWASCRSGWVLQSINRHVVAAFDFATVSGCDQLVVGPAHARGGTVDHRVDSCYREFTKCKNHALINLWWHFTEVRMKANKVIP